jgi:small-conductance mechanosensitive channel
MIDFIQENYLIKHLFLIIVLLAGYLTLRKLAHQWLSSLAQKKQVSLQRTQFILKSFNVITIALFGAISTIVLDIGFGDISLFLSSIFAVLGVALFAQWSILSNLTASVLIFFFFPYRIGDFIQVIEKDADIRGKIIDITMFHVLIKHEDGDEISYPNNMMLQKGVVKLVDGHSSSVLPLPLERAPDANVSNDIASPNVR